jgi:hypothetical protein
LKGFRRTHRLSFPKWNRCSAIHEQECSQRRGQLLGKGEINKHPSSLCSWEGCLRFQHGLVAPAAPKTASVTATATLFSWPSLVHGERPSLLVLPIQASNGCLSFLVIAHLDKAEAFRAAGVSVHDDLGRLDRPMWLKHSFQVAVGHFIRKSFPYRNESSNAGFPILRSGPIGSFPLVPTTKTKTYYLSANTFQGDSGGPVYLSRTTNKGEARLILGLIVGQRQLVEESKTIYSTTKLRYPLGLAVVAHSGFIKETIDRLP